MFGHTTCGCVTGWTGDSHAGIGALAKSNCTEIIIRATRTHDVLDENGRQSRDLTSVVQGRFGFSGNSVKHFAQKPRTVLVARHRHNLLDQTFQWCRCSPNLPRCRRIHFERMARKSVDCEMLSRGRWSQRAISMMSKDGHLILLVKPCVHARKFVMSPIPHGQQTVPSTTATSR